MAQTQTFNGRRRVRKFFGKIPEVAEMPNLIEVQKASYDQFLMVDEPRGGRPDEGLQSVFLEEFKLQPVQAAQDRDFIRTLAQSIAGRAFAADAWAARFTSRFGIV